MVVPARRYFAGDWFAPDQTLPRLVLVYGEAHLLRAAFLKGATDYLKEPWTVDELLVRAGWRRPRVVSWTSLGVAFELEGTRLRGKSHVELTAAEAALLGALVQRQGSTLSPDLLSQALYGSQRPPASRVLATLVSRLRGRLRAAGLADGNPIVSERGAGYRLP